MEYVNVRLGSGLVTFCRAALSKAFLRTKAAMKISLHQHSCFCSLLILQAFSIEATDEMSLQTCWRCLARDSIQSCSKRRPSQQLWTLYPASTAPFTTSASLSALPPKKKGKPTMIEKNVKGAKKTFVKKKKPQGVDSSRRPAPGERKALRKRIVLSNTNALEVEGLKDITAQSMIDESLRGQVLGIPGPVVDQLRAVEAFKVTQGWPLFRRPAMLMRKDTLEMATEIENISLGIRDKTIRRVFVGERGSGKTTMLLQAMTMAFLKGWVVINIPEGARRNGPTICT